MSIILIQAITNTVWAVLMAHQTLFWYRVFKKDGVPAPSLSFVCGWILVGLFSAIAISCWTVLLMGVLR